MNLEIGDLGSVGTCLITTKSKTLQKKSPGLQDHSKHRQGEIGRQHLDLRKSDPMHPHFIFYLFAAWQSVVRLPNLNSEGPKFECCSHHYLNLEHANQNFKSWPSYLIPLLHKCSIIGR